jgi:hypothetical protein
VRTVAEARAIERLLTTPATWGVVSMSANTQRTAYNIDQYFARPARHEHCPSQSSRCRVQLGVIDEAALLLLPRSVRSQTALSAFMTGVPARSRPGNA